MCMTVSGIIAMCCIHYLWCCLLNEGELLLLFVLATPTSKEEKTQRVNAPYILSSN